MLSKLLIPSSLLLAVASAQTSTTCNPLEKTCPSDPGMGSQEVGISSFNSLPSQFTLQSSAASYSDGAAELTISKSGEAPTFISKDYFLFGTAEVHMKAAPGTGIVTSIVLLSDDLDEVDWEFIGGNNDQVQTNYYGKGDDSTHNRVTYVNVDDAQGTFHNYTLDWSSSQLNWYIDGTNVRTLNYADAEGGSRYPQTPMQLKIGIWAGGDPSNANGTIQWAGGATDYGDAPFSAFLQSVRVVDASQGAKYTYGDNSGSWQSIKIEKDDGTTSSPSSAVGPSVSGTATAASTVKASGTATASVGTEGAPLPTTFQSGSNSTTNGTVSGGSSPSLSSGSPGSSTSAGAPPAASTAGSAAPRSYVAGTGLAGAAAAVLALGMSLL